MELELEYRERNSYLYKLEPPSQQYHFAYSPGFNKIPRIYLYPFLDVVSLDPLHQVQAGEHKVLFNTSMCIDIVIILLIVRQAGREWEWE